MFKNLAQIVIKIKDMYIEIEGVNIDIQLIQSFKIAQL